MDIKLAEALLRRKELQLKVNALAQIKSADLFEVKGSRRKLTDDLDDVVLNVPLLCASQVTSELDWHSRQLRLVDGAIQQANWTTVVTVKEETMGDYVEKNVPARVAGGTHRDN